MLVIDDDEAEAIMTTGQLTRGGYRTTSECDGNAVLDLVRGELIRLVISELYIACDEGPCVVAALKQERDRLPRLRVLAYTRHTASDDDEWALAAGCDGVLHKPASTDALLREVGRLDGGHVVEPAYQRRNR